MPEEQDALIKELPRDTEVVELFKKLLGETLYRTAEDRTRLAFQAGNATPGKKYCTTRPIR